MGRQAMILVDRDGVIVAFAGDAEALTGHAPAPVVGRDLDVIVPPDYRERHWAGFRAAMQSGVARAEGMGAAIPVMCADGDTRRFPARFTLVRDARGRAVGAAAAIVEPAADDPPLFDL
ncbi:PAS domain S-box protein [Acidiferrimicrobium sp. IK]|uniref:PAS domain S-box protein n=1 Tax=Acidiferrimicrobium sp. IK TaxID=2871700 RepID=UPI0021CB6624|nr:PAS domain S-box protein [Acidiferrimicrobium sp. IK]MCU4185961.1 PAS domain S-box protein [Acidiferrimicrobium sp. IK]